MLLLAAFVYTIKLSSVMHASAGGLSPRGQSYDRTIGVNGAAYSPSSQGNAAGETLTLEVVQANAPDGSTVFKITQSGFNAGKPFMCAVYGETGNLACDIDQQLPAEALLLLRTAGGGFYPPARLDADKHWRITSQNSAMSETTDYTVTNANGAIVTLSMNRHSVQTQPPLDSTLTGTVTYDTGKHLPDAIHAVLTLAPQGAQAVQTRIDIELQP